MTSWNEIQCTIVVFIIEDIVVVEDSTVKTSNKYSVSFFYTFVGKN